MGVIMLLRGKPKAITAPAKTPRKYIAITKETVFSLKTFPKDARQMLELVIPAFDAARELSPAPDRWLVMLKHLPMEALIQLPVLRATKANQANHVVVMLSVYARALLYPLDETSVRCEMLDTDVHKTSNRIYFYYFQLERYRRLGLLEPEWLADPFTDWTQIRVRYMPAGLAAPAELERYAAPEGTIAGEPVDLPCFDLDLS
jgi:hypothetical protein